MKTKTYLLTQSGFDQLRSALLEKGIAVPGTSGTISTRGITIAYAFTPAPTNTLAMRIVDKPWIISESTIWDQVNQWLQPKT